MDIYTTTYNSYNTRIIDVGSSYIVNIYDTPDHSFQTHFIKPNEDHNPVQYVLECLAQNPPVIVECNYVEPVIECSCSPWQIRKAFNELGIRDQVELLVKTSTDITIKDGWEFASEFKSDDPFVLSMGSILGKSREEICSLIAYASTL